MRVQLAKFESPAAGLEAGKEYRKCPRTAVFSSINRSPKGHDVVQLLAGAGGSVERRRRLRRREQVESVAAAKLGRARRRLRQVLAGPKVP